MSDKHVLEIRQGDDTDFLGKTNRWYLPYDYDYSSCSAKYAVGTIQKEGTIEAETIDGATRYYVEMVLTAEETAKLPPGIYVAALKLTDSNGKCETVTAFPTIRILPRVVND